FHCWEPLHECNRPGAQLPRISPFGPTQLKPVSYQLENQRGILRRGHRGHNAVARGSCLSELESIYLLRLHTVVDFLVLLFFDAKAYKNMHKVDGKDRHNPVVVRLMSRSLPRCV